MVNRDSGQFTSAVAALLQRLRVENAAFRRLASASNMPVIPPPEEVDAEKITTTRDSCETVKANVERLHSHDE